ncbi:MAG TPA: Ig domain-containing protein [Acidimicrobiales bacterium]|nr:Ig domain-containing protein [Acidimicrobiales bacterium]
MAVAAGSAALLLVATGGVTLLAQWVPASASGAAARVPAARVPAARVPDARVPDARVPDTVATTTTTAPTTTLATTTTTSPPTTSAPTTTLATTTTTRPSSTTTTVARVAPKITSAVTAGFQAGVYASFTITSTGTPWPAIGESGKLPPGLSFHGESDGKATISGTPAATDGGDYPVTITASNGVGTAATERLLITVVRAPSFTSAAVVHCTAGTAMSFTVLSSGVPTPTIGESGALPAGLGFHPAANGTATISGTPGAGLDGTWTVTLTASNGVGRSATQRLEIVVAPKSAPPSVPTGSGYWYVTSGGELVAMGGAHPAAGGRQRPSQVVAMAATTDHAGYYLLSRTGRVFNYGDAPWYGSLAHLHLSTPSVAIAVSASDRGYYVVTRAGGVYGFGQEAPLYGSIGRRKVAAVVAFALTPDGRGYWIVTAAGNVFQFGDAGFYGSLAHQRVPKVVAFGVSPSGHGYWLVTVNGEVFNFGDAVSWGSISTRHVPPVAGFAANPDGRGYWIVTTKGNVFNLGDARFFGSSAHTRLLGSVTGFALDY